MTVSNTLLPTSLVGSYAMPDWLIDRDEARRPVSAAHAGQGTVARRAGISWKRRRTTRRFWRSATRNGPGSTSSPTARCGAKAIPTASPPRSRMSTSTIRATALDRSRPSQSRCRASSAGSAACVPVEVEDVKFLRANTDRMIKITVPGPFTMTQQAQNDFYESEAEMAMDYASGRQRGDRATSLPPVPTSSSSTSPTCRHVRRRPRNTASTRSTRARRDHRRDGGAYLLRLCGDHPRTAGGLFLPAAAVGLFVQVDLDRDRPVEPRHVRAGNAAGQDDHPRRARSVAT